MKILRHYGTTYVALAAGLTFQTWLLPPLRQGFWQKPTMKPCSILPTSQTTMRQQQRFVNATQWLRPVTRWATRFSLTAPPWLPASLRNAPLRLTSLVLKGYHLVLR